MKWMLKKLPAFLFLSAAALTIWFPVLFLAGGSIMGNLELSTRLAPVFQKKEGFAFWHILPRFPTGVSYLELLLDSPSFFVMFWNSVKIAVFPLLGQLVTAVPAAWWFSRHNSPFAKALYNLYLTLMLMPFQVTMVSDYLVLRQLHLLDTLQGIIFPVLFSTFPVFILYRFFCSIPKEVIESAQIDGASPFQVFFYIGLPLGKTGIGAALVLGFLEYWNLLEQPMAFLKTKYLWPLSLWMPRITDGKIGLALAASVMILLPAALVFLCGQDDLEQGMAMAGLKE